MALQLILGSAGSGKSEVAYRRALDHAKQHPRQNHFVIVPEQYTLSTQRKLVQLSEHNGIMNVEALSFERLSFRVFDELGTRVNDILEDTGKSLLLRRILTESEKELLVLAANIKKPGFIDELKSLITEFCQYDISPQAIRAYLAKKEETYASRKLQDICLIYERLLNEIDERFVVAERLLEVFMDVCGASDYLKGAYVVFDGFTGFTPVQRNCFTELLRVVSDVRIVVTIGGEETIFGKPDISELFFMSKKYIASVTEPAKELGITIDDPLYLPSPAGRRFIEGGMLSHLEANLFREKTAKYEGKNAAFAKEDSGKSDESKEQKHLEDRDHIELVSLQDPREELSFVAADIRKNVRRDTTLRYRDIAVVCADMESYRYYIEDIFAELDIPVFVDQNRDITRHKFIDLLKAFMELYMTYFSYDSVMHYARSAFSPLSADEADILDNYLYATNLRGKKRLLQPFTYAPDKDEEGLAEAEEARKKFISIVGENPIQKKGTVKQLTEELYNLISAHTCEERLNKEAEMLEAEGREADAKETEQIYRAIVGLLDKFVSLLGEEEVTIEEYRDILYEGLASVSVGILPPQADCVMFGDIERTRVDHVHTLYFIGVGDHVIPKRTDSGGLLTQAQREEMSEADLELAPSDRERIFTQRFYLYLALTKPQKRLVLTYPKVSNEGEALRPSYLIAQVKELFPGLSVRRPSPEELLFSQLTKELLKDRLAGALRDRIAGKETIKEDILARQMKLFKEIDEPAYEKLLEAGFFIHEDVPVTEEAMQALHKGLLPITASRLERYAACAFSYFLSYELSLKERQEFEVDARDLGSLYHRAFELYEKNMRKEGLDWINDDTDRLEELLEKSIAEAFSETKAQRESETARERYLFERMHHAIKRTVWALTKQLKEGDFVPNRYEVSLEELSGRGNLTYELDEQTLLSLRGKIDRIDTCEKEDAVYLKIVDYKSGVRGVDLNDVYEGLSLQLVLYMKAAKDAYDRISDRKEIIPAAILYNHIDDPVVATEQKMSKEEIADKIFKALKTGGLVCDREDVLGALDRGFLNAKENGASYTSAVIPVSLNKNGSLAKASKTLGEEDMLLLTDYAKAKAIAAGKDIMNGKMEVHPYRAKEGEDGCKFCSFHGVCGFEPHLEGFSYRRIKQEDKDVVLEKMKRVLSGEEDDGLDE